MEIWLQRTRLSADNGMINSSEPSGIRIIGIVKWKSGSSELDCQLTTGGLTSVAAGNHIIGIVKWNFDPGKHRLSADNGCDLHLSVLAWSRYRYREMEIWLQRARLSADNGWPDLSGRWQPHYRYREMEISLLTGGDCQLTTE
ncbi:hypothetical protein [Aeromonas hydrophila]|uniref:hypothetical protein n=1 Tax=Aeromonas hydrophila TaxID=644 RepID=UPI001A331216|nr:hypothetical protein [Aeromonas hydrophila]HAT2574101.1 hypothetical protein [Aeromonas hydrophila]HAT2579053.1 hypothetical protein [Aeromonas hydrophila]HAT2638463.1 hypothetical protein [Aeromonas hydrophila]HAT3422321.1 hypothetical protein [Aeromonas hydrophila]